MSTYSSVPPPDQQASSQLTKPAAISDTHWERFQKLKTRREQLHSKVAKKRAKQLKRDSLKAVCKQVVRSSDILHHEKDTNHSSNTKKEAITFKDIEPYLTSNARLHGVDEKSGLQLELDEAIRQEEHEKAISLSDKLVDRQLAHRIAAAFDSHRYAQDKTRKKSKRPKLKWKYEHKKRWEMKGNM